MHRDGLEFLQKQNPMLHVLPKITNIFPLYYYLLLIKVDYDI